MAGTFSNLKIWQKGYDLLIRIYKLTEKFPKEEKYGITDQIRRSSNGVIANIAEAHGRYYFADKSRTLYMSRGECHETQSHLSVSLGLNYITENEFNELDKEYQGLSIGISTYIMILKKNKNSIN